MDELIGSLGNLNLNSSEKQLVNNLSLKMRHIDQTRIISEDDINYLVNHMTSLEINLIQKDNFLKESDCVDDVFEDVVDNNTKNVIIIDDIKEKFKNAMRALIQKSKWCDVYGTNFNPPPYQEAF